MTQTNLNPNNYCIIMAGGFGSRFWPLCSANEPKQFIDLRGTGETMMQSTFNRFAEVCPRENIIIVTTEAYGATVREQIPGLADYQVLCEPFRRNTAPCIAWAAAVIGDKNPNANIVVTPSDHAVFGNAQFRQNLLDAIAVVDSHDWIVTMGARPVNPNVKYGYIQFREMDALACPSMLHKVHTFVEKPPYEMACQFINSGEFLWNAGIYVWRLPVLLDAYRQHLPQIYSQFSTLAADTPRDVLEDIYSHAQSVSVDYGIMEKADNVYVLEADFGWSDVETWESLYMASEKDDCGNAVVMGNVLTYDSKNCIIHVDKDKYAVVQGLSDYVVVSSGNALLVCPRSSEEQIMKFSSDVELLEKRNIGEIK